VILSLLSTERWTRLREALFGKSSSRRPYEQYVFIATYGRSGSTLIQKILGSIPGYHITGENFFALHGLFRSYQNAERTKSRNGQDPLSIDSPWFGADQIDPLNYGRRLADLFIEEIVKPPEGSRTVGFKEVRFAEYMDELEEFLDFIRVFFRPTRVVFNLRKAEDVAKSGWWKDQPTDSVIAMVERFDAKARSYVNAHPDEAIIVSYDRYVENSEALMDLFKFLGETFNRNSIDEALKVPLNHQVR
jgi:hypothetical protein